MSAILKRAVTGYDLLRLAEELRTAGFTCPSIGSTGTKLHTYSADGAMEDLPDAAQAVIDAHVAPVDPPEPQAELLTAITNATTLVQIKRVVRGLVRRSTLRGLAVDPDGPLP